MLARTLALDIDLLAESLAVCRLSPEAEIPSWATVRPFFTISRSTDELSVICPESPLPETVSRSGGWRAFRLRGQFDLAQVGIFLSLAEPLAGAGVSILPVATHDTDYLLVHASQFARAVATLRAAGHRVHGEA